MKYQNTACVTQISLAECQDFIYAFRKIKMVGCHVSSMEHQLFYRLK